jgi:hypothetical protein
MMYLAEIWIFFRNVLYDESWSLYEIVLEPMAEEGKGRGRGDV